MELINGDAFKLTVDNFKNIDCVITDPPYGISLDSHCKRGVKGRGGQYKIIGDENMDVGNYVLSLARQAGVKTIIFFSSHEKPWPGKWRNTIIWDKGGGCGFGGDTKTCLRRTFEVIQVMNTGSLTFRDESVWRMPPNNREYSTHPCIKPVKLIERLINVFGISGVVFDPFMGSGSTGVACVNSGVDFIGMELDEKYYEVAKTRIAGTQAGLFSNVADPSITGLQGSEDARNNGSNRTQPRNKQPPRCCSGNEWNEIEPGLGRVANDVSNRVGQLKGYGNAQVPLQAAVAFSLLYEGLEPIHQERAQ